MEEEPYDPEHRHEVQNGQNESQNVQNGEDQPPLKKKRITTSIACENCRRMKVRCDSETPCARCARKKLECVYVESKKKKFPDGKVVQQTFLAPSPFSQDSANSRMVIPANTYSFTWSAGVNPNPQATVPDSVRAAAALMREYLPKRNPKESNLATVYVMNFYIDLYFTRMSYLIHEPLDFFKRHFAVNTSQGKLTLFSMLSLFFRNDGNLTASNEFLKHGVNLSKDLYDDFGSPTSLSTGLGFALLGHAFSPVDSKKARFYVKLSSNLLEDSQTKSQKLNVIKSLVLCLNKTIFLHPQPSENEELMKSFKALSLSSAAKFAEAGPESSQPAAFFPTTLSPSPEAKNEHPMHAFQLFEAQSQKDLVHKIMVKRHPDLFHEKSDLLSTDLDPQTVFKVSLVESFMFIHEILACFLPQMSGLLDEITEDHVTVLPGSISPEDGNFLLYLFNRMETACTAMPQGEPMKTADIFFMQSLVYRAVGRPDKALAAARRSMEFTFARVNIADMNPVFRVVVPLMHDAACLIEQGLFEEADTVIPHLQRFAELYPQAQQSIDVLAKFKERMLLEGQNRTEEASYEIIPDKIQGKPNFQEAADYPHLWSHLSSSSSSSSYSQSSPSSTPSTSTPHSSPFPVASGGEGETQLGDIFLEVTPEPSLVYTSSFLDGDATHFGFDFFEPLYPTVSVPHGFE